MSDVNFREEELAAGDNGHKLWRRAVCWKQLIQTRVILKGLTSSLFVSDPFPNFAVLIVVYYLLYNDWTMIEFNVRTNFEGKLYNRYTTLSTTILF